MSKKHKSIKCPFCRRKMKPYSDQDGRRLWNCESCEHLFHIEQMPYYPIKKEEEQ